MPECSAAQHSMFWLGWARLTGEDWGGLLVISVVGVTWPGDSPAPAASSRLTGLVCGGPEWPRSSGAGPASVDTGGKV